MKNKSCNVIVYWSGERRRSNGTGYAIKLLEYNIEIAKTTNGGCPYDTIIVNNENANATDDVKDLLKSIDGQKTFNGKFIVLNRPNVGISMGAYSHAYEKLREEYQWWHFTEDDYIYNVKDWYKETKKFYNSKENVGAVATLGSNGNHIDGGIGLYKREILDLYYKDHGRLCWKDTNAYDFSNEIGFSNVYYNMGYGLLQIPKCYYTRWGNAHGQAQKDSTHFGKEAPYIGEW